MSIERSNTTTDGGASAADIEMENLKAIGAEEDDENAFSSDDNDFGSDTGFRGTRYSSLLMVLFWAICIVFRNADSAIDYTTVECAAVGDSLAVNSSNVVEECIRHTAIYRVAVVAIFILLVQFLVCLCSSSVESFDRFWFIVKYPLFVLLSFALLYPADIGVLWDDRLFAWIARFAAFVFIIFQSAVFLDWAYQFNESFIQKAAAATGGAAVAGSLQRTVNGVTGAAGVGGPQKKAFHLVCLLAFSIVNYSTFIVALVLLFQNFASAACPDNVAILTVSALCMAAAVVVQMFLSNHGSVTTTSVLGLYVAYLSYTAVALNPSVECNGSVATNTSEAESYGLGPVLVGIILSFLSVVYMAFVGVRKIASILTAGDVPLGGLVRIALGRQSSAEYGYTGTKLRDMHTKVRIVVLNLTAVFVLDVFYIAMVMTSWGTIVTSGISSDGISSSAGVAVAEVASGVAAGSVSMYMNAIGGWIAVALYIVSLLVPRWSDCMPSSVWDLRLKASNA